MNKEANKLINKYLKKQATVDDKLAEQFEKEFFSNDNSAEGFADRAKKESSSHANIQAIKKAIRNK